MAKEEADKIGEAFDKVLAQYAVKVSKKTEAWINLATVLGMSYGSRIFDYKLERAMKSGNISGSMAMMANLAGVQK